MPKQPKDKGGAQAPPTPVMIAAFTRSGALKLMKTYRDKIGAKLHDREPVQNKASSLWEFKVTMPWKD